MSVIIYFGDNDVLLGRRAKAHDSNAFLIETSNCQNFLSSEKDCVCYTSLADLPKDLSIVVSILLTANKIIYCPPKQWSDGKSLTNNTYTDCIQRLTENLLLYVSNYTNVENIELCFDQKYNNHISDTRKTNEKQLWIAGCSVSHGDGVTEQERYGATLSKKLDLPCSFLTKLGSSISWAANQILKSDIRNGDILCWGITSFSRVTFYCQDSLIHVTAQHYHDEKNFNKILPIDHLDNENNLYHTIESIREVINFCQKLKIQLVMFDAVRDPLLNRILRKEKYYYQYPYPLNKNYQSYNSHGLFVDHDLGSDNLHPGPISHQHYSNFLAHIIDTRQQY